MSIIVLDIVVCVVEHVEATVICWLLKKRLRDFNDVMIDLKLVFFLHRLNL